MLNRERNKYCDVIEQFVVSKIVCVEVDFYELMLKEI